MHEFNFIHIVGAITGLFITSVETPIDLVKTKLQIQIFGHKTPKYTTVLGCVRYLSNKHGFQSLWQGAGATAVRNVPGTIGVCICFSFKITKL